MLGEIRGHDYRFEEMETLLSRERKKQEEIDKVMAEMRKVLDKAFGLLERELREKRKTKKDHNAS